MAEVVFRDGSIVLTYSSRTGLAIPIISNIPMEVVLSIPDIPECDTPYLSFHLQQADDPAGPWEALVSTPSWSFHRNPAKCPPYTLIPHTYEASIQPTKAYMRDVYGLPAAAPNSAGYLTLISTYETMSDAVYERLMRAKRVTLKQIEACDEQEAEHITAAAAASDKRAELELGSQLWDNFLSDEIANYELLQGGS